MTKKASNRTLHRTTTKRFSFDASDYLEAGFATSARFRWQSVC
jgi:hypothetical protein